MPMSPACELALQSGLPPPPYVDIGSEGRMSRRVFDVFMTKKYRTISTAEVVVFVSHFYRLPTQERTMQSLVNDSAPLGVCVHLTTFLPTLIVFFDARSEEIINIFIWTVVLGIICEPPIIFLTTLLRKWESRKPDEENQTPIESNVSIPCEVDCRMNSVQLRLWALIVNRSLEEITHHRSEGYIKAPMERLARPVFI